ncbi:pentapeptide repeat-containing protein [Calothrix sp. FACHB-1219]|uniref:pentapeptide repeat-containing protein n=1 Tax=unclassified Calothrix TaxID=2619626 RepID=UPI00168A1257|nr:MULTISPECIES: pentapeptide repeat-containing protein [unclassified Calothrix]MBD2207198.1 pentapeptide repeat-containing protein [Calothrix sp. FACHB-168]MBD2221571.1 pentapeptide repeat-containing protein [Calothrix sp. FACHB-1219]
MAEESTSNLTFSQQPPQKVRTLEALLKLYAKGHRNFSGSDLRGVTVNILDQEVKYLDLSEIILRESNLTAIVFNRTPTLKVNLTGADFSSCYLQGADLSSCRLDQCNFSNSDLTRANLARCSCRGSDFIQAKLQNIMMSEYDTDLTASNFTKANLTSSYLSGKFSNANFRGCNFYKVTFKSFYAQGSDFSDADLREIQLPAPTTVDLRYSYYNHQTKFSKNFDPIAMGMELIEDKSDED